MPLNVSALALYICLSVAVPEFDLGAWTLSTGGGGGLEKVIESVYG